MAQMRASGFEEQNRSSGPSLYSLFSYGFRPFFLGASVYAVLLMTFWIFFISLAASGRVIESFAPGSDPFAWHAHEMIFGFAAAAVAGFLLTAVPNWTGALPLSGAPLVGLFLVWAAGRVVMIVPMGLPYGLIAAIDLSFLPLLAGFAGVQLMARPVPKNLVFLLLVALLTACNVAYHLASAGYVHLPAINPVRGALLVVVVLIAIIGGRIIPAFTHNWLHLNSPKQPMPLRVSWLDVAAIGSVGAFALATAFEAPLQVQGTIAVVAAVLNAIRLLLWRGWVTRREPIVWILHAGYAWIVVGLALSAASSMGLNIPTSLVFHAFGAGAAGTMIMAVMSRASLGHTGRPLKAPPKIVWAYWAVSLAALFRIAGPLVLPQLSTLFLTLAALSWIAAFSLFVAVYAHILTTPRVHTKLG